MQPRLTPPAARVRVVAGVLTVVLTAATLALRLPATFSQLSAQASRNDSYTALGRTMAAADSLDIDNTFVAQALTLVPNGATFALLPPTPTAAARQEISPITSEALAPYLRYLMLPSREVPPRKAAYLLCYMCDVSAWGTRAQWLWTGPDGLRIGHVAGRT